MNDSTTTAPETTEEPEPKTGTATYCPEDNKLRLYVGRVPRDEYEALRAEGWTSTPKQACDFVATWTPDRAERCLKYADFIEDEDQTPEERAADRAERFSEYRDKRHGEALGMADRYDAGPSAHGFQSERRAERAASRHDRIAGRACDAWGKAEYWQRRTAGVISHALYKSTPAVRMGRIKEIETDLRRREKWLAEYAETFAGVKRLEAIADPEQQTAAAIRFFGGMSGGGYHYMHPRPDQVKNAHIREHGSSLYSLLHMESYGESITGAEACALYFACHREPRQETEWTTHLKLRLAYEFQMMEAQGGRAAFVEMEPGGWLGSFQVQKVNKSNATGRVVSVNVLVKTNGRNRWGNPDPGGPEYRSEVVNVERFAASTYRPPTDEERAAFIQAKKAAKAAAPKGDPCPLINPSDDDAEHLQAIWNEEKRHALDPRETPTVLRLTQEQYSARSAGPYGSYKTVELTGGGIIRGDGYRGGMKVPEFPALAKVRKEGRRVIVITDKPQKPFPRAVWNDPRPAIRAEVLDQADELRAALRLSWLNDMTEEQGALVDKARSVGLAYVSSMSQFGLTDAGKAALDRATPTAPAGELFAL